MKNTTTFLAIALAGSGCAVGESLADTTELLAMAGITTLAEHPAQARLFSDLQCDEAAWCSDDAPPPVSSECQWRGGPWLPEAKASLADCAAACTESNCAAYAAAEAGLSAPEAQVERCEAATHACDLQTDACDALAVTDATTRDALDACHTETCEALQACYLQALGLFEKTEK